MNSIFTASVGLVIVGMVAVKILSGPTVVAAPAPYQTPLYMKTLLARIGAEEAQAGPSAPKTSAEAAGIHLRSVGFSFPTDGRAFPAGPGADLMASNCMSCHTPGMILNQPALTRAEWTGEVTKMVKIYKAPIDDADLPAIVTYLAGLKVSP